MKKNCLLLLAMVLLGTVGNAQNWKPVSAAILFKTKMLGVNVDGRLGGFSGYIRFNPNDLATAQFSGSVDASSIDTDNSLRNKHLKEKEEFFHVSKFPSLKMKSLKVERDGINFVGLFELTIKGITKQVRIPFTFKQEENKAVFRGQATINRKDWTIGGNTFGMSSDVTISILINAVQN